jgi:hypothetical protein
VSGSLIRPGLRAVVLDPPDPHSSHCHVDEAATSMIGVSPQHMTIGRVSGRLRGYLRASRGSLLVAQARTRIPVRPHDARRRTAILSSVSPSIEGEAVFDRAADARSERGAAEADLVAARVAVGDLADAIGVGLPVHRLDAPLGDRGDAVVEVVDEDRVLGVAGVFG